MIKQAVKIEGVFVKEVLIDAMPMRVWDALVLPELMKQWMFDSALVIDTDWEPGRPIVISGDMHGLYFENRGMVLKFVSELILAYSHLSSLSDLPDEPSSYSVLEFNLAEVDGQTSLNLMVSNFPTEEIYKHLLFYWSVTLELLKKFVEGH